MMSTKWLSKRLQNSLKTNPKLKLKDIKEKAQKKWIVGVNKTKAIRAKFATRDMVDGSFLGNYTRIYDYCHEVLRTNPGSTVKLNVTPVQENVEDKRPYFKRLYICYAACKKCFKLCRPIIGLDGCFLKGLSGGQILAAIGTDPNDQMLPISFAVVEGETKDSWSWFLELLIDDLGGREECRTYTFISDQQKGLLPAMDELLPNVEQRFCVRHLYNNFRKKYPGKLLKEIIWKAARATYLMSYEFIFEVRHIEHQGDIFGVNLKDHDCSCRKWQLTGLPCVHALSAMKSRSLTFDDYIPEIYKKARYISVYEPIIYPVNGTNLWVRTEYPDVQPPKFKKMPGRPKKKRNREQGEIDGSDRKMRKTGMVLRCTRCRQTGHNKSTCKMTPPTQASQPRAQPTPTQASQPGAQPTPTQASQSRAQTTPTQTS
ncbi:uncharacterized protein LOC131650439 [Vicia villosa]|uniref:uncharacterized protein LOC131650439 n=1 Tax=Vicia villosa TaxID=3911 RepID=UPI00273BD4BE|nr:uncharacterized protein LOC131650439 [Vicia villosa]